MSRRKSSRFCVAIASLSLGALGSMSAQEPLWISKQPKAAVLSVNAVGTPLAAEIPRKDWVMATGAGTLVLALLQRNGEASILVERTTMNQSLDAADITDVMADIEADLIRERDPRTRDFESRILDFEGRRIIAIQHIREGVKGYERVRQYSVPEGQTLYRIACAAELNRFQKYEPIFAHFVASLRAQ